MKIADRVFFDQIEHDILGSIYVCWGEDNKILSVRVHDSDVGLTSEKGSFKDKFPDIYNYLKDYGKTAPVEFDMDLLDLSKAGEFQKNVYKALIAIPKGTLVTYSELAYIAGYPKAARAVGTAMRKNNHLLLIPCHRVVAVNGIGGFSCGLDIKRILFDIEGVAL